MSLYFILNDRFGTPMIEKQRAVGFARGLVNEAVKSLSEGGGRDEGYSQKFAAIFARRLARVRNENGPVSNAIHRAKGFAGGFGEGFALARAELEDDAIDSCQREFLDMCLHKVRRICLDEDAGNPFEKGVPDAFDKGLAKGGKRAAKQRAAKSRIKTGGSHEV